MSSDVLQEIENSIRYGDKAHARELLDQVLQDDPSAQAWFLAAQVVDNPAKMREALQNALRLDPQHEMAKKALDALGTIAQTPPPAPAPEPAKPAPVSKPAPKTPAAKEGKNTVYDEGVYEMLWDCKYCGTAKLLGKTHRFCPNCGSTQDPEWRYYPAEDEKVAVKDHVYVGADHTCPSCGTLQAANVKFCTRCGAPQDSAEKVRVQTARVGDNLDTEDLHTRQQREFDQQTGRKSLVSQDQEQKSGGGFGLKQIIIIAIVVAVIGGIIYALTASREAQVTAAGFQWERVIYIEELRAVSDSSLCSSMPAAAYSVTRRREQVDTRRVQDGEVCTNRQVDNGDGTFRSQRVCEPTYREEPVYGDVCYYSIDRWVNDRDVTASGDKNVSLAWPATGITRTGSCRGCEREAGRDETYIIVLKEGEKLHECPVDFDVWQSTNLNDAFTLNVRRVGGGAVCDSLEKAG